MPYLRVRIASANTTITSQQIATNLTRLAVDVLGKDAAVAAVDVKFTDPSD